MIGTAAIPITALSAKLISMNRNNRATTSQASFGVPVWWVLATPPDRTAVSRISALVDREAWTLMVNSVQVGYLSVPFIRVRIGTNQGHFWGHMENTVITDRSSAENPMRERILGAAFEAFTEDGYAGTSARNRETRQRLETRSAKSQPLPNGGIIIDHEDGLIRRQRSVSPGVSGRVGPMPNWHGRRGGTDQRDATQAVHPSSSSSALASFRSGVSKPSVNQPCIGARSSRALPRLPCLPQRSARSRATRSSIDRARW